MGAVRTRVAPGGRVVIPAAFRAALGLKDGDEVRLELAEGEVRLVPANVALRRAQEIVARYVPAERRLSDELLAERRAEAARE